MGIFFLLNNLVCFIDKGGGGGVMGNVSFGVNLVVFVLFVFNSVLLLCHLWLWSTG